MKKIFIAITMIAAALTSCAGKAADKDAKADPHADTVAAAVTDGTAKAEAASFGLLTGVVNELENDTIFRGDSKVNMLTVLDFNAVWCGPCRAFSPVFDAAAKKFKSVMFVSVDVDRMPLTAHAFGIQSIPTVIFIKPDGTIRRFVGLGDIYPADKFDSLVNSMMTM